MSIRSRVIMVTGNVAEEHKRILAPLTDDLPLLESGLDSLSFAVIVARLEDELNVDPLTIYNGAHSPVTLGDFIAAYENAGRSISEKPGG